MKIPEGDRRRDKHRRYDFFRDLIERCRVSRTERRENYTSRRFFWLYGTDGSLENTDVDLGLGPPPGNKIWPHLDQLTSFLYAQETTRFACQVGSAVPKPYYEWVPKINEYVNDVWHMSNTDLVFGTALTLALVYDSMFIKPLWRGNQHYPGVVFPHNFGVLREDVGMLSRQEAFCHWYPVSEGQFRNDFADLPRLEPILKQVAKRASGMIESQEAGIDRIIMSSQSPLGTASGPAHGVATVDWLSAVSMNYVPRVREEMIEMCELFIYDDALRDYRIVTLADPDIPIFDRPLTETGWLAGEPPFVQICPNPDPHYFWGMSECERLMPLQAYRNRCLAQIEHLQDLQAHPPSTSSGFPSDLLEMQYVLDTPNGFLNQPDPAGLGAGGPKAERVQIQIPQDLYERLSRIDEMFAEMSGLPPITMGQNPPGVRAGGHAMDLAKLGSSRARKRAMVVEDSLEALATVYLRLAMKYDPTMLQAPVEPGKPQTEDFVLHQFTKDFLVKVDAHSNSPIFVDDQTALAFQLFKAKAIDRETLLEMLPIPSRQLLIHRLKSVIEPSEAAAQKAQHDFELKKAEMAGIRGRTKGARTSPGNGAAGPDAAAGG
jgi:hypothetical protein